MHCTFVKVVTLVEGDNRLIGLVGRVFVNGSGDRDSIPSQVIPKTQKMVLDTSLLKTRHYKIRIKKVFK